ncbi:MAG TPA: aminopeptidase, partial [Tepidisphaeraceae bacterium]|nr:aminopeptidase [Tepidisphaeraceae bacterium]
MRDPRIEKLADVLVNYSVGVKKGHLVRITSTPVALSLVGEIFRRVLAAGAHPFTRINAEETQEIFLKNATPEQLSYLNPIFKFEQERIDCSINIWGEQNTRLFTGVDPEAMRINRGARKPLMDIFMNRAAAGQLKWCGTQFPNNAAAQDADMSLSDYEQFVFSAGMVDQPDPVASWKRISEKQQRLADFLKGKKDYRVVAANGTDIRMSVAGHHWINCDGHENFPDGEVFTGPVVDSVNGQINFTFPAIYDSREVCDVKLTFKNGKVINASANKGEDFLFKMLDMDAGSRFLGECAIGTNYSI